MKQWTTSLVYASLIFLVIWLSRAGYLSVPQIKDPFAFALSLALLFSGFTASVFAWRKLVQSNGYALGFRAAAASVGLTIFGKYIPGKVWSIVGRASYIADHGDYPLHRISALAINAQILTLWSGLLLGSLTFFLGDTWGELGWMTLILWLVLTVALLTDSVRKLIETGVRRMGRVSSEIPRMCLAQTFCLLPYFLMMWVAWGCGFICFASSLTGDAPDYAFGFAFVLATTVAVMALLSPGGLGIREGILVLLLTILGATPEAATTISVTSRLWFLIGEVFIFMVGSLLHQTTQQ